MKKLLLGACLLFLCAGLFIGCGEGVVLSGSKVKSQYVTETITTGNLNGDASSLKIRHIGISGNAIVINGLLDGTGISLKGTLYKSIREDGSGKILVGTVSDEAAGLRSAYLEVNTCEYDRANPHARMDTNCWVFDDALTFEKTFLLYLIDNKHNFYVFESKLEDVPIDASRIDLERLKYTEIPQDAGWYASYVGQTTTQGSPQSEYMDGCGVVTKKIKAYGITSVYTAYPYCEGSLSDISGNGGVLTSSLRMAVQITVDGVDYSDNHNMHLFKLKAHSQTGRLGCTFAAGENTAILSFNRSYSFHKIANDCPHYIFEVSSERHRLFPYLSADGHTEAHHLYDNTLACLEQALKASEPSGQCTEPFCMNTMFTLTYDGTQDVDLCCNTDYIDLIVKYSNIKDMENDVQTYGVINWQYSLEFNQEHESDYLLTHRKEYTIYGKGEESS